MRLLALLCLVSGVPMLGAVTVNVQSYGAVPDGVTDDTNALVKASAAVAAQGGILYFPPGTYIIDPTRGHIALGSNMTIQGPGTIRVKPGVGNFEYVIGPNPTYAPISNVVISGITVDENVLNNPSTVLAKSGQIQNLIEAYALDGLTIQNSTFYLSGVYLAFVKDHLTMTSNLVKFQKRTDTAWFDNSAVYLDQVNGTCSFTSNAFTGLTAGANTALELHTTSNCTVKNNTFDNYATAVLPLDSYSLMITGNKITRAEHAISIWSIKGLQNLTVSNNNISLNNADRKSATAAGISYYWCKGCGTDGSYTNVDIENNTVTFQAETRTTIDPYSFFGISTQATGNTDTVVISGNTINNAPVRGIKIGNSLAPSKSNNIIVENNSIVNSGNNGSYWWYGAAIAIDGNLSNVKVSTNTVTSTTSTFKGHFAVWSDMAGAYQGVTAASNQAETSYVNQFAPAIQQ
jgi:hypothetical protein